MEPKSYITFKDTISQLFPKANQKKIRRHVRDYALKHYGVKVAKSIQVNFYQKNRNIENRTLYILLDSFDLNNNPYALFIALNILKTVYSKITNLQLKESVSLAGIDSSKLNQLLSVKQPLLSPYFYDEEGVC